MPPAHSAAAPAAQPRRISPNRQRDAMRCDANAMKPNRIEYHRKDKEKIAQVSGSERRFI